VFDRSGIVVELSARNPAIDSRHHFFVQIA